MMEVLDSQPASPRGSRTETIDRISGGLVNIVLGALILWVGQTTFRHAGMLAGFDQKFSGVGHQFDNIDTHYETLRTRIDRVVSDIGERTRSRFTREDAEKMSLRIKEIGDAQTAFERQIIDRLNAVQLKVIALETNGSDHREIVALRSDLAQLQTALRPSQPQPYATNAQATRQTVTAGGPTYLPPVPQRR